MIFNRTQPTAIFNLHNLLQQTDRIEPDCSTGFLIREHDDNFRVITRCGETQRLQLESIGASGAGDGLRRNHFCITIELDLPHTYATTPTPNPNRNEIPDAVKGRRTDSRNIHNIFAVFEWPVLLAICHDALRGHGTDARQCIQLSNTCSVNVDLPHTYTTWNGTAFGLEREKESVSF